MSSRLAVFLAVLFSSVLACAPRAAAQSGSLQFVAHITPSGGEDEPVRSFPFYLLTKSYVEIEKEAVAATPVPSMDAFIDTLSVSKELKAWMKVNHRVNLAGDDFTKMIKPDDIINVPEFFSAYVERMTGDRTVGFPTPKYKLEDKEKDPAKYARLLQQYHDAIRAFFIQLPTSVDGLDLSLEDVNPGHKWDMVKAKSAEDTTRRTADLARGKYLVARANTDLQGQGLIRGIPPGNYWLGTLKLEAVAGDARERWDVPVTIRAGQPNYVTLSNINAAPPAGAAAH